MTPCAEQRRQQISTGENGGDTVILAFWGQLCDGGWKLFIPIVLLAILVQLFAPIAAFRAFAYAAIRSPLYGVDLLRNGDIRG